MRTETKPDTRRFFAEPVRDAEFLGLWDVRERRDGDVRHICSTASGVLAKRIANALNIYVPKKKKRGKERRAHNQRHQA